MRIGLSYDLKTSLEDQSAGDDALEEYDSPETVDFIARTFLDAGHEVVRLGGGEQFLDNVRREKVDIVFNIAEGRGNYRGREAQVPAVLEMLDIPYTGSDPQCLAVCLDKPLTKRLVASEGISTPRWLVFTREEEINPTLNDGIPLPAIVKPAFEGSSKGIRRTSLAFSAAEVKALAGNLLRDYHQPVMVEEFIDGDEVTVGILGNRPPRLVGMMRILPRGSSRNFIYSLEVKRDYLNLVDYESPVRLPPPVLERIEESSLRSFNVLGCRDFARVDFRIGRDGTPYFLEINPLPGLGSYSDLVIMAIKLGWKHSGLILAVLEAALERYHQCVSA